MSRDEILDALEDGRENLLEAIDGLSDEALLEPGVIGDWSVKDLLYHISMWEAELVKLLWQAAQGGRPASLWTSVIDVDAINEDWHAQAKDRSLESILADFRLVRKQTGRRLSPFSDEDLNNPERYPWLKGDPLWKLIEANSFGHEAEHAAQVSQWRQKRGI